MYVYVFFYAIKKVFSPLCVRVSNRLVTQLYYTTHFSYACSLSYIFLIHSLESVCSVISFCFFLFLLTAFPDPYSAVPRGTFWVTRFCGATMAPFALKLPALLRNEFYRLSTWTVLFGL